jgi:hypothetical protein
MTLNWDTEAESVKRVSDHVYFKVLNELASTEEFNKELYGVEDLGVTNYTGTVAPLYKLNLIMAGEESTVGGVTVQQYLAEVERTITDPTLTSTYEKLFKEAAKYRKTRFIIPL